MKKYQHLEKLNTVETEGILDGKCFIFPKLDGTNSSLWFDGGLKAGSRNRELTLESDNAGFYNWAIKLHNSEDVYEPMFNRFFASYPDLILYGEWLVPHTLKNYRESAWRKFYVFDVYNSKTEKYLTYEHYAPILNDYRIDYIPAIAKVTNPSEEFVAGFLDKANFLIDEGNGEGIVIKNYDFVNRFGRTTWAKIVRQEFKEMNMKVFGPTEVKDKIKVETLIADKFITYSLVEKEYAKIAIDGWSSKMIPRLLNTIYYCLIKEEMWEILKEFKSPTIEFNILQKEVFRKIKLIKPEIF